MGLWFSVVFISENLSYGEWAALSLKEKTVASCSQQEFLSI